MAPIPTGGTVAVTGSAGFIGGWVVRLLLDEGYRVRACVRNVGDLEKTAFLEAMPGYASGRLTLHPADLDQPGCFDDVFKGCDGVAHLSHVSDYQDHDYVKRVCDHIITSIERSETITRVIVTSSIAAVMEEVDIYELEKRPVLDEDRYPDEHNPKRTAGRVGYSMGKVIAERSFSDAAAKSDRWDAITCCPGDNVGPILSAHQKNRGPWQHNIEMMLLGEYKQTQAYRPWMTVDVRDTAECHMRLLESIEVQNGERYIAWSTDMINVEDICAGIDRLLPELGHDTPEPTEVHPERIQAREAELRAVWAGVEPRNHRMRAATGVEFRPFDESLRDCVESLLAVAEVTPKLRPGFSPRTPSAPAS